MPATAIRQPACILAIAAVLSLSSAVSLAQQNRQTQTQPAASSSPLGGSVLPAPVGHRQPRAADIKPTEKTAADAQEERLQAELERKLKICRGC